MSFPCICAKFTFVTIGQLEILSYNIVFHKRIAQCSNRFITDPNWPITNLLYNVYNQIPNHLPFSLLQHVLSFGISPYFSSFDMQIIWGVCVTDWIYWFNILQYFQYFSIYLVFIRSGPAHSLQVMMSINLIYFIIYVSVLFQWLSVWLQCQMQKGEREMQPFQG